ncbi:MAG: hypothetical protein LC732_02375 [Acidobacteria bacterium]|nr:hypothetical protein [Acidobacteriota bacterium]
MKNQYFGDVNDYRKYGILRAFSERGLRLGVVWMMTPDDGSSDGSLLGYLESGRTENPALFSFLRSWRRGGEPRAVEVIEKSDLLGETIFHDAQVPAVPMARERWFAEAMEATSEADVLFFDPDNGLPSKSLSRRDAPKYLLWEELSAAWRAGKSVVVYQHFWRAARASILRQRFDEMTSVLGICDLHAVSSSQVAFLVSAQPAHAARITKALEAIRQHWGEELKVTSHHASAGPSFAGRTTAPGFINRNSQRVIRKTDLPGNDYLQRTYELECGHCSTRYGSNGSDIFQRKCPSCMNGRPGLVVDSFA